MIAAPPVIAIASGKGGTGKTTVAIHLAVWLAQQGQRVQYIDCDVEEPNGHLFLKPDIQSSTSATIPVPVIDMELCTSCGKCAEACKFKAIAMLKKPMLFSELCHGCGACTLVCPVNAIHEEPRSIGTVETGSAGDILFAHGRLYVGEPMSPPLIRTVKGQRAPAAIALLDAPAGNSCPVITTVRGADFVMLVTEPTPFGLHDLALAVETFRPMNLTMGVVVNRSDDADQRVQTFCAEQHIPILAELPDDRRVAEIYARGELVFNHLPEWREHFKNLWARIGEHR